MVELSDLPLFKRLINVFILRVSMWSFWKSTFRRKLFKLTEMKVGKSHIGQDVIFDNNHPEYIEIGDNCAITYRCVIITCCSGKNLSLLR